MSATIFSAFMCSLCLPGEYELHKCTNFTPTVCWPCSPGFFCKNGTQYGCPVGLWSQRGADACEPCLECEKGTLQARACDGISDTVCASCPAGFGCDGSERVQPCAEGMYSENGVCVWCSENRTTLAPGAVSLRECICEMGDDDNETGGCLACVEGAQFVAGMCRNCPAGHGCDDEHNVWLCDENTYSRKGRCVACMDNSVSAVGSSSEDDCMCTDGYVKVGSKCEPCKSGTVFRNGQCDLCEPGEFCLGKTHHEPCPNDTYSYQGAATCLPCRPYSECGHECTDGSSCTCVSGYVERGNDCRRCPAGTWADSGECLPCKAGFECAGGPDVQRCAIGKFSPGNLSQCSHCLLCPELTAARCNATHDSVCEKTTHPLAIISVWQRFKAFVDGNAFVMFAMVYASSLPKAQLRRACDTTQCVECFQGICPAPVVTRLYGPVYELTMEMQSTDVHRLKESVDALAKTEFLLEIARTTMAKLSDVQFSLETKVEYRIVCPEGSVWDGKLCAAPVSGSSRTWAGLAVTSVVLIAVGSYGLYQRRKSGGKRSSAGTVEEVAEIMKCLDDDAGGDAGSRH